MPVSIHGHDLAGNSSTNQSAQNLDAGETFYDDSIGQLFVCSAAGIIVPVNEMGNVAKGAAGNYSPVLKKLTAMVDNTATNLAVVTVPNAIHGACLKVTIMGTLGDGDSTQVAEYLVSLSRITGAASKITISSALNATRTNGATANASVTLTNVAVAGANSASQTFQLQATVARSAGASSNHVCVAKIELLNGFGTGITIS